MVVIPDLLASGWVLVVGLFDRDFVEPTGNVRFCVDSDATVSAYMALKYM